MRTERILSVFLACMMLFSVITFAVAEEETQDIDLTELFQETAELDLESETKGLDIASLASKFLSFAVNSNLASTDADGLLSMVTNAVSSLSGDTLSKFKTNFLDNIVPAVSGLLSGDNSILSSLSDAQGLLSGVLGEGASDLLGSVSGLLGGNSEGGFDASSLLSMIGVNTDANFSLSDISGIWDNLKNVISSVLQ